MSPNTCAFDDELQLDRRFWPVEAPVPLATLRGGGRRAAVRAQGRFPFSRSYFDFPAHFSGHFACRTWALRSAAGFLGNPACCHFAAGTGLVRTPSSPRPVGAEDADTIPAPSWARAAVPRAGTGLGSLPQTNRPVSRSPNPVFAARHAEINKELAGLLPKVSFSLTRISASTEMSSFSASVRKITLLVGNF